MIFRFNNMVFEDANEAFSYMFDFILVNGHDNGNGTKAIHNIGFYMNNPGQRLIACSWRKWSGKYAEREWQWYVSQNRSVSELKKFAPTWDKMHNGNNIVNSNYGWQWNRNNQLENAITLLADNHTTRQACVTIFDGKESGEYVYDTPCTMYINFIIMEGYGLCMEVHMRSNDLVYGFCNDQYCFSKLQEYVASRLDLPIGWYYHFANNLHIYEKHYDLKPDNHVTWNEALEQ